MQEAAAEEPYEEIPVEEVTSAATFKKPFERRESWQEEAALLTPQAESIRIHKEDIPEPVEEPVTEWQSSSDMRQLQPETEPVVREPAETATAESDRKSRHRSRQRVILWQRIRYIRILRKRPNSLRQNTGFRL